MLRSLGGMSGSQAAAVISLLSSSDEEGSDDEVLLVKCTSGIGAAPAGGGAVAHRLWS